MKKTGRTRYQGLIQLLQRLWKLFKTLGLPYRSLLEVKSFHLHPTCLLNMWVDYCGTYNGSNLKWHNMSCVFLFILKYFCNPLLCIPSICLNFICFKVQMTLGVQLSLGNQWKVYSNLRRIWIILINICHLKYKTGFLRIIQCCKYLKVLC